MNRWRSIISIVFLFPVASGCAPHSSSMSTPEMASEFKKLPVKKQVGNFNRLAVNSRMDLLAEIMREGGEFSIAGLHELKFFPDGEFVYDELGDQGYKGGGAKGEPVRYFRGRWTYVDGKIFLQDDPKTLQILSEGYTWVGAEAEVFQNKKLLLNMKLVTKEFADAGEESLFLADRLDSPAIRSYAEKKKGGVLAGGE